ncbi:methyl-accepting chemotaxis protein [Saprospira grandis]|uniref:methyl-accepting chemotaxis protein n=1 Tax=Saprospira grandis TaxID=1008 RepID=UPI0022DD2A6A|nr:methyl-accepting chemotaxis protein [Saprospira grandis]WBM73885.1 methyl-accepting chemotaxis protein [Saprospira grandis]
MNYQQIYEQLPTPAIILSEDLRIAVVNQAATELLKQEASQLIGEYSSICLPFVPQALQAYRKGERQAKVYELYGLFEGVSHLRVHIQELKNEAETKRYLLFLEDQSEQAQMQAGSQALQLTIDKSFGRIEFDPLGNILYLNDNFAQLMGFNSAQEVIGKHHSIFVSDSYKKSIAYQQFWQSLALGQTQEGEFKRQNIKGEDVWIQAAYTPVKNQEGKVSKIVKIALDITKQKAISLNAEALRETIDSSFGRIEFDPNGNILDVNDNFVQLMGFHHKRELLGHHHSMLVDPDYRNSDKYQQFWADLSMGQKQEGEFRRISKTGKDIFILAAYTPVEDESGRVTKVVKIANDISRQKEVVLEVNRVVAAAGQEGNLGARLKLENASGDWLMLVDSVNMLLESVSTPIGQLGKIIDQLAEGDLTGQFDIEAQGDIRNLSEGINQAILSLNGLLTNTAQIADLLATASEEMLTKGEEMQSTTKEAASATQQMAQGAQQQAQQTDEASKQMDELLKAANLMKQKAELINQAAHKGQSSSSEGLATLKLMVDNMESIRQSAQSTAQSISVLSNRSEEIASTLSIITDIASQTNLLALNAAIEAARAGEAGRGFAVVAEEIRKLAEGSRRSAVNIERIIREVQKDIYAASRAIELMEENVKSGGEASKEAEEVFKDIQESNNQTFSLSESIVYSSNQQKEAIDATVRNIEKIVVVAEETAYGTEQVANSTRVLSQGMNEVSATSKDLAEVATQLQENILKFKLR